MRNKVQKVFESGFFVNIFNGELVCPKLWEHQKERTSKSPKSSQNKLNLIMVRKGEFPIPSSN